MDKEYYKKQLLEIKFKIACLPVKERELGVHPYYQELKEIKKKYAGCLIAEKMKEEERKEHDKHKRR